MASFAGRRPSRSWTVEECAVFAARKEFELLKLLATDKQRSLGCRVRQYTGFGACIGDLYVFVFIILYYVLVLSPGARALGAWHVAVLSLVIRSSLRRPRGGGSDRNAESDGTRSRRRCGADPNPCPQPLPLHTDGDVCGEGVNTGRSGVALTRPGAHSSKSSSSESESERLNILGSDGAAAGLEPRKSDSSRLPHLSARALRSSACTLAQALAAGVGAAPVADARRASPSSSSR